MAFFQSNMHTNLLTPNFNEHQWVKQIRKTLEEELEQETEIPVSIFVVPKVLMLTDPESYIPQEVAIGPYHNLKLDLYDMERYKLAAAKRNQKQLQRDVKFEHLVEQLMKNEIRIRASYHRPLSIGGEALAWMMAVDASFLFEFLQVCRARKGKVLTNAPSTFRHLVDISGNKTAHNAILRDVMMLENQIPLFVMRMQMDFLFSSIEYANEFLQHMLIELSKELSPFKTSNPTQNIDVKNCAHLLDFVYQFIVPKIEVSIDIIEILDQGDDEKEGEEDATFANPGHLRQLIEELWKILSRLERGPVQVIKRLIFSKPLKVLVKLPWTILTKIPIIKMMKVPVENMFRSMGNGPKAQHSEDSTERNANSPPVLEEIKIPSITELLEVGVRFEPMNGGITTIKFDAKTRMFYFPVLTIDVNSEAILRNLVAYEACVAPGPLVLGRYTELMNGIIDSGEDAKFLCQKGIIQNHLKSELEVANLWNGMSKSVRLTKVPCLDEVIGEVNKFYDSRWKVKCGKFMKKYVFASWKILTFLAAIMLLLLTVLQSFCEVYRCSRIFRIEGLEPADG